MHLSLQVRDIDAIVIDQAYRPDSSGGEVQGCGRSQSTGTDQQHARRADLLLTGLTDFKQKGIGYSPSRRSPQKNK
jgi:hypothetical protein